MNIKSKIMASVAAIGLSAMTIVGAAGSASATSQNKVFLDAYSDVSMNFVESNGRWTNVRPGSPTASDNGYQKIWTKGFYAPPGCITWTNVNRTSTWTRWEAGRDHLNAFPSGPVTVYNMWVDCRAPFTTPGWPRLVPPPER